MVKLDNWQTKAEKAAERRTISKQKKQQRDRTRTNKSLAQQLLSFLDEHNDQIIFRSSSSSSSSLSSSVPKIHVWTDSVPSSFDLASCSGQNYNDNADFELSYENNKRKGRGRSGSFNIHPPPSSPISSNKKNRKGRPRSNSDATGMTTKNKVGARNTGSNIMCISPTSSMKQQLRQRQQRLCAHHFFGRCTNYDRSSSNNNNKNKGSNFMGCPFGWHPSSTVSAHETKNPTLADVLLFHNPINKNSKSNAKSLKTMRANANKQVLEESLAAAMNSPTTDAPHHLNDDLFSLSSTADNDVGGGGIAMLYHQSIVPPATARSSSGGGDDDYGDDENKNDDANGDPERIVEALTSTLSKNNCSIGSIVYVVLGSILIFDRYREGLVLSDVDKEQILFGGLKRRSISIGEEEYNSTGDADPGFRKNNGLTILCTDDSTKGVVAAAAAAAADRDNGTSNEAFESPVEMHKRLVLNLPGQVLEYILTFLPEQTTAIMPLVCKSWYNEIGRTSPDLWRHLLGRHEWPVVPTPASSSPPSPPAQSSSSSEESIGSNTAGDTTSVYRTAFVSHYKAVRNVKAVVLGLQMFENREGGGSGKTSATMMRGLLSRDVAQLHFKEGYGGRGRRNNIRKGGTFVKMWSENRVLVANAQECTLNLYDVVECGVGYRCKQEVRVSVSPCRNTKKRPCEMIAIDLDNQTIGCLFKVNHPKSVWQTWLGIVQREHLLCTAGTGGTTNVTQQLEEGALCTHNLEATVLDHILSCDDIEIMDFLCSHGYHSDGFEITSIDIVVNENIVACGNGKFLFEVAIRMPMTMDDDFEDVALLKIFLFSSNFGKITWVGPNNSNSEIRWLDPLDTPRSILVGDASDADVAFKDRKCSPSVAFLSAASPDTIVTLFATGPADVEYTSFLANQTCRDHPLLLSWTEAMVSKRKEVSVVTPTTIVLSETWADGTDVSVAKMKTIFSFLPLDGGKETAEDRAAELIIEGNCSRFPMQPIRNDHMLVFCENYNANSSLEAGSNDASAAKSLFALLIHIPSRKVVFDAFVGDRNNSMVTSPGAFCLDAKRDVIAVSINDVGLFVAGHGVASSRLNETQDSPEKNQRADKKKKKGARQKAKKDGFARGMRQSMG